MQQIANWLQKLDLGQYAERFAENDINFAILPDLTDQDLKELGAASLGHRRQLLRAITELKGGETATPQSPPPLPPQSPVPGVVHYDRATDSFTGTMIGPGLLR
jgi:hypothetical protein